MYEGGAMPLPLPPGVPVHDWQMLSAGMYGYGLPSSHMLYTSIDWWIAGLYL
jgi:hypothetical protein